MCARLACLTAYTWYVKSLPASLVLNHKHYPAGLGCIFDLTHMRGKPELVTLSTKPKAVAGVCSHSEVQSHVKNSQVVLANITVTALNLMFGRAA